MRAEKRDIFFAKALGIAYSEAFSSGLRNIAEVLVSLNPNPPEEWKHCLIDLKEREIARLRKQLSVGKTSQTIIDDYLKSFAEENQNRIEKLTEKTIRVYDKADEQYIIIPESEYNPDFHIRSDRS